MELGRFGIWTSALDRQPAATVRQAVSELDRTRLSALWVGEAFRREPFANSALFLSTSSRLVVATGIANIWARDAQAMRAGQLTLAEAYPARFLLGLGVSHVPLVDTRGHRYDRPYTAMRAYLEAMDRARYESPPPAELPPRVLAALGPRMLELAAERADGAHPYFVPVSHTELARRILGPGKLLCPEQAVVIDPDPGSAREVARRHTGAYLRLPNYRQNLRRLGFSESDCEGGGSDRLVDAIVAHGDAAAVAERIRQHLEAGADHVAIQVLTSDPLVVPLEEWRELDRQLLR